jgi:hypothetical protein
MLIIARKYLSGSAEDHSLTQGTVGKVADSISEEEICRFGAPVNVVIDPGPENKKWTDQLAQTLPYPEAHHNPLPCCRKWSTQMWT